MFIKFTYCTYLVQPAVVSTAIQRVYNWKVIFYDDIIIKQRGTAGNQSNPFSPLSSACKVCRTWKRVCCLFFRKHGPDLEIRFRLSDVCRWSEESCIALVSANSNMSRVCHLSHNDMPSSSWCESNVSWCQHHKAMAVCGVTMVRPDNHYFIKRPRNIYSGKRHTLNNPTIALGSCRRRLQLFEVTAVNLIKVSVLESSFFIHGLQPSLWLE